MAVVRAATPGFKSAKMPPAEMAARILGHEIGHASGEVRVTDETGTTTALYYDDHGNLVQKLTIPPPQARAMPESEKKRRAIAGMSGRRPTKGEFHQGR